jgi:hypothetical protein
MNVFTLLDIAPCAGSITSSSDRSFTFTSRHISEMAGFRTPASKALHLMEISYSIGVFLDVRDLGAIEVSSLLEPSAVAASWEHLALKSMGACPWHQEQWQGCCAKCILMEINRRNGDFTKVTETWAPWIQSVTSSRIRAIPSLSAMQTHMQGAQIQGPDGPQEDSQSNEEGTGVSLDSEYDGGSALTLVPPPYASVALAYGSFKGHSLAVGMLMVSEGRIGEGGLIGMELLSVLRLITPKPKASHPHPSPKIEQEKPATTKASETDKP